MRIIFPPFVGRPSQKFIRPFLMLRQWSPYLVSGSNQSLLLFLYCMFRIVSWSRLPYHRFFRWSFHGLSVFPSCRPLHIRAQRWMAQQLQDEYACAIFLGSLCFEEIRRSKICHRDSLFSSFLLIAISLWFHMALSFPRPCTGQVALHAKNAHFSVNLSADLQQTCDEACIFIVWACSECLFLSLDHQVWRSLLVFPHTWL